MQSKTEYFREKQIDEKMLSGSDHLTGVFAAYYCMRERVNPRLCSVSPILFPLRGLFAKFVFKIFQLEGLETATV